MATDGGCPECSEANPALALFCMACGASLAQSCPRCGADVSTSARFCIACGAAVTSKAEAPRAPDAATAARAAEQRRTVTVLFADLSGFTSVAERLDHEAVKTLIERCLTRFAREVERFGGRVDKYIGDSVMAVFGAPIAHEDDPERAVRAALGMQAAMAELNQRLVSEHGFEFALRVGVNTGEVLAGKLGDGYTVLGDAVNVASRLQTSSSPGTIIVGQRTQRATDEVVDYLSLEPLALKGKAEPVPAWRVLGLAGTGSGARGVRRETPLIGRHDELAALEMQVARVTRTGEPRIVTVLGEAGVGKSRLLRELTRSLAARNPPVLLYTGRCLPFGSGLVYWPLREMLRSECSIDDGDAAELAWAKLSHRLGPLTTSDSEREQLIRRVAPLALLLGIDAPDAAPDRRDQTQHARESLFAAVRSYLEAIVQRETLVLAWEDIHWADEGMLDLIEYLSQWLRAPVLQVCLAREDLLERRPGWGASRRTTTSLFLDPLTSAHTRDLIGNLLSDAVATPDVLQALAERAGGNPLFAEEMVQRLAEEGSAKATELPDTVQGLLAARLDSLAPLERKLVAHAAVIGQTFWEGALLSVAEAKRTEVQSALNTLREKDIIVPSESARLAGEQELAFKHVLIREAAYAMLPKAVRARKHYEVGAFIEQRAGERPEQVAALLAEHYSRAAALGEEVHLDTGELDALRAKALQFLEAAGDAASALYSNREALAHYEAAAALAAKDPARRERIHERQGDLALRLGRIDNAIDVWQQALDYHQQRGDLECVAELHRKIGAALAHKGERTEAIRHHQQGINLIKDGSPSLALVRLYEEAAWLYMQVGDNMLAIYASEKALRLAEQLGEVCAASRAHGIFGRVFGRIGDTAKARENLERAIELARDSDEHETVVAMLALGHHLENVEGDYDAAAPSYAGALALAERIGDVPAQIELHAALAQLACYRCDWQEVRRETDASAELALSEGLIGKLCLTNTLQGLLGWRDGDWDGAERLFTVAHELADQLGWSETSFAALLGLATTMRDRGDLARAESTLAEALAVCERAGLISQSVQAHASLALTHTLAGHSQPAREAAEQAQALAERAHYPVGQAYALEAQGIVEELPAALETLRGAGSLWERLDRPLDVARCELLLGRRLRPEDPEGARKALTRAADSFEELGVSRLAEQARDLMTT
jgi:class 3 adenylate cyclase/tetratricopeptide (TPR) repeat protein